MKTETGLCKIKLRQFNNTSLEQIRVTYLPINRNISITSHKLQWSTLDCLVVNSWTRQIPHWIYVILSRVRKLSSLILNEKLDEYHSYQANDELIRWERIIKETIEKKHSRIEVNQTMNHT